MELPQTTMPEIPHAIGVGLRDGHYRVLALEDLEAGQPLLRLQGLFVETPSRYSVQVSETLHVAPPPGLDPANTPERYLWRFLNHACDPNAAFQGLTLVARRAIRLWEEIGFDYNTTEWEIEEPFLCRCGACEGRWIRGFKHLDARERRRLAPCLAPHLARSAPAALPT